MNSQVSFGPLTRRVMAGAKWTDQYPGSQALADELEQLLAFAQSCGALDAYVPRLQAGNRQRDAALAEIRVARFFKINGFPPQPDTWKPNGGPNSDGEFTVQGHAGNPILVEVKCRSWQSEISEEEKHEGRLKEPKHKYRADALPVPEPIRAGIDKAYPKFRDQAANLLVIDGEDFRLPLSFLAEERAGHALYMPWPMVRGYFMDSRYENLGGLGIFCPDNNVRGSADYKMELYVNAFALPSTRLPRDFIKAFNGIRLWDDPTEPDQEFKGKRLGRDGRLDRDMVLDMLAKEREALRHYGVKSLRLFGSAARGENDPASDLDFVVELDPKTFANYMGLKEYLENLFGCRVDLVTEEGVKPALRENILSDCVHAAGL